MANDRPLKQGKELYLQTFLTALLAAGLMFLPFIFSDRGYFLFYGDFNVQQIPFYRMCHDAIRKGDIFWNWNTDLGVNFIGSYSFYLLGSPFFWLTIPFPSAAVPHLMGPLLILKFACAALTSYLYIRRFTYKPATAMLCSILYAFSGFSVYNIFFNHFHEAIIYFPLLLLSLELFIAENKRGFFAVMVFLTALSNYFFFFGMVVFTVIYWMIRTAGGRWKQTLPRFFAMLFEAAAGVAMAAFILLPSFYSVIQNERLSSFSYGWNALLYGKEQIFANILQCFFFPPDIPARPVFFPGADVKWSSLGGWLPLFGMTGVIAFLQAKKGHWARRVICVSAFMALVPVLNSAFYMFNSAYYARWFYMPILIMCVATAQAIDDRSVSWDSAFRWSFGITLAVTLVVGFFPSEMENGRVTKWGLFTDPTDPTYIMRYWVTCGIALVSLVILKILLRSLRKDPSRFVSYATAITCGISVLYGCFFIGSGKQHSHTNNVMINQLIEGELDLGQDDKTFRVDVYDGVDNTGMFLNLYSINAFHSIVPGSVTEFYEYVGEERGVASRPTTDTPAIRNLLSVKYLLNDSLTGEKFEDRQGDMKMPGYHYYKTENDFRIYTNDNYIPMGFVYDYSMDRAICERFGDDRRDDMMLKALLLEDADYEKYADILPPLTESDDYMAVDDPDYLEYYDTPENLYFDDDTVKEDCARLRGSAASDFVRGNRGFTCSINLASDNLVFFSVPYENGWSAYVNGKAVPVIRANVGFMAVPASEGLNNIEFVYRTPGLYTGIAVTVIAAAAFAAYIVAYKFWKQKHHAPVEYPEGEELSELWGSYDIADSFAESDAEAEENAYFGDYTEHSDDFTEDYAKALGGFNIDDSFLNNDNGDGSRP